MTENDDDQFWQQAADAMAEVDATDILSERGFSHGITVKPGETLVLSFQHRLTDQQSYEITERLRVLIPGVSVVVLDDDIRLTVLAQGTEELRDMVSEMMIDKFRQLARQNGMLPK
jgi:hypothetical protein